MVPRRTLFHCTSIVLALLAAISNASNERPEGDAEFAASSLNFTSDNTTTYLLLTKKGTTLSAFNSYIQELPKDQQGVQAAFPYAPFQAYIANLTSEQALSASKHPIIDIVMPDMTLNTSGFDVMPVSQTKEKRNAYTVPLTERANSSPQLRILSVADQKSFPWGSALPDYMFEPLQGEGQYIYIVDTGFNLNHVDFKPLNGRTIDTYVVPNEFTLSGIDRKYWPRGEPDASEIDGHGTAVAAVAGGRIHGVASRANLVLVKCTQMHKNPVRNEEYDWLTKSTSSGVAVAWLWMIADIRDKRRQGAKGQFIVNFSGGFTKYKFENLDAFRQVMNTIIPLYWSEDIITVVAAGNSGISGVSIDESSPQQLGTPQNGLITVGGVYLSGILDCITNFDRGRGGSLTLYALSRNVRIPEKGGNTGERLGTGTSLSSPAVAGLAAYFASLPSLQHEWKKGSVAVDMKNYLTRYAYVRVNDPIRTYDRPEAIQNNYIAPAPESVIVAYNRAGELLCPPGRPGDNPGDTQVDKSLVLRTARNLTERRAQGSGEVPVVVSGHVVATSFRNMYCSLETPTGTKPEPTQTSSAPYDDC